MARKLSKSAAQRAIKREQYKERAKKMRPYIDGFSAGDGFDLRDVDSWTPQQKRKVTRYWEVMAIQISRPHVAKFYKNKERLEAAIDYAQQDRLLPGQKAALIPAESKKSVSVKFDRDNKIQVKRHGVGIDKVSFNPNRFLSDPYEELERALSKTDAKIFKIMTGPHETKGSFRREELPEILSKLLALYDDSSYDADDKRSKFYGNWLRGLIGFKTKSQAKLFKATQPYAKKAEAQREARAKSKRATMYKATRRALLTGRR